jgi:stage II sporulation protein R
VKNMVRTYRFPYRSVYGYFLLFVVLIVMAFESQQVDRSLTASVIPTESFRLRILANSDDSVDQAVKRRVRDAVIAEVSQWVKGPVTLTAARDVIGRHLPEIEAVVANELRLAGERYDYAVELAIVPFPTKMYGGAVYPAGDYEALRITLGAGAGQNWWCVMFPPLCFVDAATGEGVAAAAVVSDNAPRSVGTTSAPVGALVASGSVPQVPEIRFFIVDLLSQLLEWLRVVLFT